jgi:tetratricopeptide (TPR) repeat protein/DNA-binding SARP family transcriptional activator
MPSGHPLLEIALQGEFHRALEIYREQFSTNAEDDRWAGFCLINAGHFLEASTLLRQSIGRGCRDAHIELAMAHRCMAELDAAQCSLEALPLETLDGFDSMLARREAGMIALARGDLPGALRHVMPAWEQATTTEEGAVLRAGLAQALGFIYSQLGQDVRADHHLELALHWGSPAKRGSIFSTRALCLAYLGRFEEAQSCLIEARGLVSHIPREQLFLTYHGAVLERAQGQWQAAQAQFAETIALADAMDERETEAWAQLGACAVNTALEHLEVARAHLHRAQHVARGARLEAACHLRAGAVQARAGDDHAIPELELALAQFQALHLERETCWTWLHLAEAHLRFGHTPRAEHALRHAVRWRHALGIGVGSIELAGLPLLLDHLSANTAAPARVFFDDWHARPGRGPRLVRLRVFGETRLEQDGQPVRLSLTRSLEVLAYLASRPKVHLRVVKRDLFPDTPENQARLYFHQVRYELQRVVPSLEIPFDRASRSYRLEYRQGLFSADVMDFKAELSKKSEDGLRRALELYTGSFMPDADSEWANTERANLMWSAIKVGLELIGDWYDQGEFVKCLELAGRMLEIDPCDESVGEYLIRATQRLKGSVAAVQVISRLERRFEDELGEVPAVIDRLKREILTVN